jgi:hypothetical protein
VVLKRKWRHTTFTTLSWSLNSYWSEMDVMHGAAPSTYTLSPDSRLYSLLATKLALGRTLETMDESSPSTVYSTLPMPYGKEPTGMAAAKHGDQFSPAGISYSASFSYFDVLLTFHLTSSTGKIHVNCQTIHIAKTHRSREHLVRRAAWLPPEHTDFLVTVENSSLDSNPFPPIHVGHCISQDPG